MREKQRASLRARYGDAWSEGAPEVPCAVALSKGVAADRVPGPQRSLARRGLSTLSASLPGLTTAWCLVLAEQILRYVVLWKLKFPPLYPCGAFYFYFVGGRLDQIIP